MPKVFFVNEHREAEAPEGDNLKGLTERLDIDVCREPFVGVNCGAWGLCGTCQVWVRESVPGAAGRRTLREWFHGMSGQRRLACQVRVLGDIEVVTMAATSDRVRRARPIAPAPTPSLDPSAPRRRVDEAKVGPGTA